MELPVTFDTVLEVSDKLINDERQLDEWSSVEQTFWHSWQFVLEVNNGGFYQFFFNLSGDYTRETVAALIDIGAFDIAKVLENTFSAFQCSNVPMDMVKRRIMLENVDHAQLRSAEDLFFNLNDDGCIDNLLIDYVRNNMLQTILPFFIAKASAEAKEEFRNKNYVAVLDLLAPFEDHLQGTILSKLKFARKK